MDIMLDEAVLAVGIGLVEAGNELLAQAKAENAATEAARVEIEADNKAAGEEVERGMAAILATKAEVDAAEAQYEEGLRMLKLATAEIVKLRIENAELRQRLLPAA